MGSPLGPALANRLTFLCAILKVNGLEVVLMVSHLCSIDVISMTYLSCFLFLIMQINVGCICSYVLALVTNFSVAAAMIPIVAKLSVILRSECMSTCEFLHSLGKRVKGDDDSAITEHLWFCNHTPGFEYFSILATNNSDFKVTLMESFLINRDHPPLSKNKQSLLLVLFDSSVTGSSLFQLMVTNQI